jgi:hypothetical protein
MGFPKRYRHLKLCKAANPDAFVGAPDRNRNVRKTNLESKVVKIVAGIHGDGEGVFAVIPAKFGILLMNL